MKKMMFLGLLVGASTLGAADVSVTVDSIHQRWPWESKIDVDFTVTCPEGETVDAAFDFNNGSASLLFPEEAISGSCYSLTPGEHRITLDPSAAGYSNECWKAFSASVSKASLSPLYIIIDLEKPKGAPGQVTYLSKSDILSGNYGSYEENPVPGVASIAWTGVTNDVQYATTKYVMRRIEAGTFMMGAATDYSKPYAVGTNRVTITRPFYIGVFETTQRQWELVAGSNPSYFKLNGSTRPVEGITYAMVRGSAAAWPTDGYGKADAGSFLQKMCELTGLVFDLPTYAQWQYASAGTKTGSWYNNGTSPSGTAEWSDSDKARAVARISTNAGAAIPASGVDYTTIDTDRGTAKVGSYACNAFGLYDMHGNVWEFLLDWANNAYQWPLECSDPTGPDPEGLSEHMWCGGSFRFNAQYIKLGFRGGYTIPLESKNAVYLRESGFRMIVMP